MTTAFIPMLAHDPEGILALVAWVLAVLVILNAAWYWFVNQVGFMLAGIGTQVERWCKVVLPLILVPISFVVTICGSLLVAFATPAEDDTYPVLWMIVGIVALVVLLLGVPYVIGRYMLRFSIKRSLIAAFFMTLVYVKLPLIVGMAFASADHKTLETTVEEQTWTVTPKEENAPEDPAAATEEASEPETSAAEEEAPAA